jgi:hypothetical protein
VSGRTSFDDLRARTAERRRAALLQLRLGVMVQASERGYAIVDYDALEKLADRNEDLLGSLLVRRTRIDELRKILARAAYVAEHLFQMIPQEEWRAHGAEYMGQYEGDYHAEQTRLEIEKWKEAAR